MKKNIFIILLIFLLFGIIILFINEIAHRKKAERNLEIEILNYREEMQNFTPNEFKKFHNDIINDLKENDINYKKTTNIIKYEYRIIDSTSIKDTLVFIYDTINKKNVSEFNFNEKCYQLSGTIIDSIIDINYINIKDTILTVIYKEKKCLFKKPVYKVKAISSCSGSLPILNNIYISKKNKKINF